MGRLETTCTLISISHASCNPTATATATTRSPLPRPCHSLVLSKHEALATRQRCRRHRGGSTTFPRLFCLPLLTTPRRRGGHRSTRTSTSTARRSKFRGLLSAAAARARHTTTITAVAFGFSVLSVFSLFLILFIIVFVFVFVSGVVATAVVRVILALLAAIGGAPGRRDFATTAAAGRLGLPVLGRKEETDQDAKRVR